MSAGWASDPRRRPVVFCGLRFGSVLARMSAKIWKKRREDVGDEPPAEVVGVGNAEQAAAVLPDPGVADCGGDGVAAHVEHGHDGGGKRGEGEGVDGPHTPAGPPQTRVRVVEQGGGRQPGQVAEAEVDRSDLYRDFQELGGPV